jgi:hypothetical protein
MDTYTINLGKREKNFYMVKDIKIHYPELYKGCTTPAHFIKKKDVPEDKTIHAREVDGEWTKSKVMSCKFDKTFVEKEWFDTIFSEQINDKTNTIADAPAIIELTDAEKFKDNDGNVMEIEVRGTRNHNDCYFLVKDIMKSFELPSLYKVIVRERGYTEDTHYKYFYILKVVNDEQIKSKKLYLTYEGLMKAIFTTTLEKTKGLREWATRVLFTVQLGTEEQKTKLAGNLLGVSSETLRSVFNKFTTKVPCVYLISIGKVKHLREKLHMDDMYNDKKYDNQYIYKYGQTTDMAQRAYNHTNDYEKKGSKSVEIIYMAYIDPQYVVEAESFLTEYFTDVKYKVAVKKKVAKSKMDDDKREREIVIIPTDKMKNVLSQYQALTKKYAGCVTELVSKLKAKEHEIELVKAQYECKVKDATIEIKDKEMAIKDKEMEIKDKKMEIKDKEIEIMKMQKKLEKQAAIIKKLEKGVKNQINKK